MNKKEIIEEFVNSKDFEIIESYISEPYEETIKELDEENQQLKEKIEMLKQADRNTYESAQDMLSELDIENQQLKEQNNSLRTRIKTIKRRRKLQSQKIREYKELITNMQKQLQQKNEAIEKAVSQIWYMQNHEPANSNEYDFYCRKLIWILTSKGDN